MGPCIDVYVLTEYRDAEIIGAFADAFVDRSRSAAYDMELSVLPVDYTGAEDTLETTDWDFLTVRSLDEIIGAAVAKPARAFRAYVPAVAPLCGALLCFTTDGGVIFGISVDDPLNEPEAVAEARQRLAELMRVVGGGIGWAIPEERPPLDPWSERQWGDDRVVAVAGPRPRTD